ncbi:MAG: DUF6503 family protein [Saprospiraceae bacterium]|nr:DUF6503 family protein [Saprospiraceae bacterium]
MKALIPHVLILLAAGLLIFAGCSTGVEETGNGAYEGGIERLPDNKAGEVVANSIDYSGGWNNWKEKRTLSYRKITEYFDSTGNQIRRLEQLHQYQLRPQLKVRISWQNDGTDYMILYDGEQAKKYIDREEATDQQDVNHAWNSSFGSHYVMCMPFKLTDPGTVLSYEGMDTLHMDRPVHSVRVDYEEGAGSAAGMHTWWYYFEPDTYSPVANFLDYGDGYSYTEYAEFTVVDSIRLNKRRISYATNARREIGHKTTVYTNEDIRFDASLPDTLFRLLE